MNSSFRVPPDSLGADLVWWRESSSLHTLVTIYGAIEELNELEPDSLPAVYLECVLFTTEGKFQSSWRESLPRGGMVVIDSAEHSGVLSTGLLAIFLCAETEASEFVRKKFSRLYSMVDWYSREGEIASLHNDHSLIHGTRHVNFTEIVLLETEEQRNYLVVLNGPEPQPPGSIRLEVQNHKSEVRTAPYAPAMAPFSVHSLHLSHLFPGLADFGEGSHILLGGRFESRGVFVRPYVMTEGRSVNAYHGGNRYEWAAIPRFVQKYLGRGEVNPMVALHQETLTTTVNVLNSHGNLESDFWVDARLYDEAGRMVAERERWLLARRNGLARGDIADLLPDPAAPFAGHIALNFSDDNKSFYPRRLQALLEYRTPVSAARVMAWSDVWNGRHKLRELNEKLSQILPLDQIFDDCMDEAGVTYHCHYRMWFKPPIVSHLAITNCGIEADYSKRAPYILKLRNRRGESVERRGDLAPQATDWGRIDKFFPRAADFAGSDAILMATIDSPADLAVMHLTEHERSGVYSAEHFMASGSYHQGRFHWICGS